MLPILDRERRSAIPPHGSGFNFWTKNKYPRQSFNDMALFLIQCGVEGDIYITVEIVQLPEQTCRPPDLCELGL
jgi:hypothetical protein